MPNAPVRVLIASRSPAWAAGITSWLGPPLTSVDIVLDADAALTALAAGGYALVMIDDGLPDSPGPDLAGGVRALHPDLPVILLGPTCTRDGLLEELGQALGGDTPAPGGLAPLTAQEDVVFQLMRRHLTYKEIAQTLGVSWHTVRTHAQSILRKRGVHSRRDLDALDLRLGALSPPHSDRIGA